MTKAKRPSLTVKALPAWAMPQVDKAFNSVFKQYLPRETKLKRDWTAAYVPENLAYCCGIFEGKKLVAQSASRQYDVAVDGAGLRWASYGNVLTLPEYRGRGLGTKLNRFVWGRLKQAGVDGVYISGGRSLYTRMGAAFCGQYWHFKNRASRATGPAVQVRQATPADLPALIRLHATDRVAIQRQAVDFKTLFDSGWFCNDRAKAWLIHSRGSALAYAVAGPAGKKSVKVLDFAGSRAALAAGLPQILKRLGRQESELSVAASDKELLWLLQAQGLKGKAGLVPGTQLILDGPRMFKRLRPYFEGRLGSGPAAKLVLTKKGGGFRLSLGAQSVTLKDLHALAKLVFGDKPSRRAKVPGSGRLAAALRAVFPLPFPNIGLSWM